jgi:hypothetical protein
MTTIQDKLTKTEVIKLLKENIKLLKSLKKETENKARDKK